MKKAEIKRRKRVVPANMQNQIQNDPNASDIMDEDSETNAGAYDPPTRHHGGPIPVDFTDTFRQLRAATQDADNQSIPRKRSFSVSVREEHPYEHAQNRRSVERDERIDPDLMRDENVPPPGSKEAKRAELQREAEQFRRMLMEKERELAALE